MAGAGWHKAGPDQELPPHVTWNQVSDAERRSLDGSASAENISQGQQRGPTARSNSYRLPQGALQRSEHCFELPTSYIAASLMITEANV